MGTRGGARADRGAAGRRVRASGETRSSVRADEPRSPDAHARRARRDEVEAGRSTRSSAPSPTCRAGCMGKRERGATSSSTRRPSTGSRAATTCSRSTWRWTRARLRDGELGARLRRLRPAARPRDAAPHPVARGDGARALRRRSGTTARRSRRRRGRCCARRSSGRAALGFEPMFGSELEFYLFKETLRRGAREALPRPDAVGAVHPRLPRPRDDLRRAASSARSGTACRRAGIPVESSKGEAWPGQHEINFRYADALTMADNHVVYKNGAKEIAHQNGCSITFMAKPDHTWIGTSCHIHSSLWRDGENAFAGETRGVSTASSPAGSRCARELALFLAPNDQLVQALRGRKLGADDARLGPRQPHVRLPDRRPRPALARRDADPRRRRQPVPRLRGADRGRPARDRARARAAAGARGQRVRVRRRALPVDAARGDRCARGRARWRARRSATRSSTTT